MAAQDAEHDAEHEELMTLLRQDGLHERAVVVPTHEVLFVKGVLEAYPGVASVHAERGRVSGDGASLMLVCDPAFSAELDSIIDELKEETGLSYVAERG